jgi:hypothetical protein
MVYASGAQWLGLHRFIDWTSDLEIYRMKDALTLRGSYPEVVGGTQAASLRHSRLTIGATT